jgi:protein O-GlcNAc transferase
MSSTLQQMFAAATAHHRAGRVMQAAELYQQIVMADPMHADAWHLWGIAAQQQGQPALAVERIQRAIAVRPTDASFHANLGASLKSLKKLPEAVASFQTALRLKPDMVEALNNLGATLRAAGRTDEALECYRRALSLRPDYAEAHVNLGNALADRKQFSEAIASYERALAIKPDYADAQVYVGQTLRQQGFPAEAAERLRAGIERHPTSAAMHNGLGNALFDLGKFDQAAECFLRACELNPRDAAARNHLGLVYAGQWRTEEARSCYQEALRLEPNLAPAHNNLGNLWADWGQAGEAEKEYRQAVQLDPEFAAARYNLAATLSKAGQIDEAAEHYRKALELEPREQGRVALATLLPPIYASSTDLQTRRAKLEANIAELLADGVKLDLTHDVGQHLFYLPYQGYEDRELLRDVARLHQPPPNPALPRITRQANDKIHIGFISRYFRDHTIGELMRGVIAHFSRQDFCVHVLSLGSHQDEVGRFIRDCADHYLEIPSRLELARESIVALGLDVLFYTDIGMDATTWSLAFSRLAPLQCTTWGHPETTGVDTIDYYISSELFEAADADRSYTERLIRLPSIPAYCYRPTFSGPQKDRGALDLPSDRNLYACPQSPFKFHPAFDDLLGGILRQDPRGELIMVESAKPHWNKLLKDRFATTLADVVDRVRWLPWLKHDDFLSLCVECDALLDPPQFNGGNTSYKALAMGTPIVTMPGRFLRERMTLAMYNKMGVTDCVASGPQEYIDIAGRLGNDAAFRQRVRSKILAANSVLYENLAAVRELEGFFRQVVKR